MAKLCVRVPDKMITKLHSLKEKDEKTLQRIVEKAIEAYIKVKERKKSS